MFPSTYDDAYYTIKNIILNNTAVNESNIYWSSEVRPVLKILKLKLFSLQFCLVFLSYCSLHL